MRRTDEEGKAVEETWRSKRQIAKDEGEKRGREGVTVRRMAIGR